MQLVLQSATVVTIANVARTAPAPAARLAKLRAAATAKTGNALAATSVPVVLTASAILVTPSKSRTRLEAREQQCCNSSKLGGTTVQSMQERVYKEALMCTVSVWHLLMHMQPVL